MKVRSLRPVWLLLFTMLCAGLIVRPQSQILVGYALLSPSPEAVPPVVAALFSFTNSAGVLVTQAGVGAAAPVLRGRIFVDQESAETGIAIVNTSLQSASVTLTLRDSSGVEISRQSFDLGPGHHRARFVSEFFPDLPSGFSGSLTFEGIRKLAAITLRQGTNAFQEVLYTTLPVVDLDQTPQGEYVTFPHIAAGGGYSTQLILMNSTAAESRGTISLYDSEGAPLSLSAGGELASKWPYILSPNGTRRIELEWRGDVKVGYAVVSPEPRHPLPNGCAIFRFRKDGGLVTEAGVGATEPTTSARLFVDNDNTLTGVALANSSDREGTVSFSLLDRNGTARSTEIRVLKPRGHLAIFAHQLFPGMSGRFTGIMEIASTTPVAPITLKLTINERGDLVYTTLPVADLDRPPDRAATVLPQIAIGGGFSTRLIFINGSKSEIPAGTLGFFHSDSGPMMIPLGGSTGSQCPYRVPSKGGLQFFPGNEARVAGIVLVDPSTSRRTTELAVNEGSAVRAGLVVLDEAGAERDDIPVNCTSLDPEVAVVDANGLISGRRAGFSTMIASACGVVATGTINVVRVGIGPAGYDVAGIAQDLARRVYLAATQQNVILLAPEFGQTPELYAGVKGTAGLRNEARLKALFRKPAFLALDQAKATLYVSDGDNHVIRAVYPGPEGRVATVAGTGTAGYRDGSPGTAMFRNPQGLALDGRGNLWVVDSGNHVIRRINFSAAAVSTVAGKAGSPGCVDGRGDAARFNLPAGSAIERDALPSFLDSAVSPAPVSIVVADAGNRAIRRVTEDGRVETVGSGSLDHAMAGLPPAEWRREVFFEGPEGVAADSLGNIYVTEPAQNRVQVILASTGQVVPAAQHGTFQQPHGVAITQTGRIIVSSVNVAGQEITYGEPLIRNIIPGTVQTQGGAEVIVQGRNFSPETVLIVRGVRIENLQVRDTGTLSFVAPPLPSGLATVSVRSRGGLAQASLLIRPPVLASLPPGHITTIAGGTTYNDEGAAAAGASIGISSGVALDSRGSLYVADGENNLIRRIDSRTGLLTTVAGMIAPGPETDGELGIATYIVTPNGLAFDSGGNLFFTELLGNRLRRLDARSGIITTIAGRYDWAQCPAGCFYGDGVPAQNALLYGPRGIAIDGADGIIFSDTWNNRVRRVDAATGIIRTVAGNGRQGFSGDGGPARDASLNNPSGVAVDRMGNLYIADTENSRIRKVEAVTQRITTLCGTGEAGFGGDGGPARLAALDKPTDVAVDAAGALYIVDWMNSRIRKITPLGVISTVAGTGAWGFSGDAAAATAAALRSPTRLCLDGSGRIYISDTMNNRIRLVDAAGRIDTVAGNGKRTYLGDQGPAWAAALAWPHAIAMDRAGNLLIADQGNRLIRKINATTGIITTLAGTGMIGDSGDNGPADHAEFSYPRGLAVDSAGDLFVADTFNNRVRRIDSGSGVVTTAAGNGAGSGFADNVPATAAPVIEPWSIACDGLDGLIIAETGGHRVRRVNRRTGMITTVAGNGLPGFSGDGGRAAGASLNRPVAAAIDAQGNVFIADHDNHRIRRVDSTGFISTYAGNGDWRELREGPALSVPVPEPMFVMVDAGGNLYVSCDSRGGSRVLRVDSRTRILTRVAGDGSAFGSEGDGGPAAGAKFWTPVGLAFDLSGNLVIADQTNGRIRAIRAPLR